MMRRPFLSGVLALLLLPLLSSQPPPQLAPTMLTVLRTGHATQGQATASYIGSAACQSCHSEAFAAWSDSDHARSMGVATTNNVLGHFDNTHFKQDGINATFFQRDNTPHVRINNSAAPPTEFLIAYTLGHYPLQQYLIPFPDGRLQALSIAWDSRPRNEHGQRWFHLYPGQNIAPTDALHWTGAALNWDRMCAQCHSTGLQQDFNATSGRFSASWSDINVACEACHGPASHHLQWTRLANNDPRKGFAFILRGSTQEHWQFMTNYSTARRQSNSAPDRSETDTCAYCHARRATMTTGHQPGQPLAATQELALLDPELYFADGQQKDEVFEYGSFVQSKMYQAGVTCSNCHNPHSGRLRAKGNALCAQCHQAATFDSSRHHGHLNETAGSQCINCHMPTRLYMQVDARHDHSFQVPRPDLSTKLGTPNVCTGCHRDHSPEWATQKIQQWHPDRIHPEHFSQTLYAGQHWQAGAPLQLEQLVIDPTTPAIVRATALQLLMRYPGQRLNRATHWAVTDPDPLLRQQAAAALPYLPPGQIAILANQLLDDAMATVRIQTVQHLLHAPSEVLQHVDSTRWQQALDAMRTGLQARRDRVEALLGLAALAQHLGDRASANTLLQEAIVRHPDDVSVRISLSEVLRQTGQSTAAHVLLSQALDKNPNNADLHDALAMAEVRAGNTEKALSLLNRSVQLAPDAPHHVYRLAIALHETGQHDQALELLETSSQRFPAHIGLLTILTQYAASAQRWPLVRQAIQQLQAIDPEEPSFSHLHLNLPQ